MSIDALTLIRNILLRTVAVIFLLNIVMVLSTLAFWNTWADIVSQWFHMNPEALGPVMLSFFTAVKFFVIYGLLAPALAIHWTVKSSQSENSSQH